MSSWWKNRYIYRQLMDEFVTGHLNAIKFTKEFFRMMRADRDSDPTKQYKVRQLAQKVLAGHISGSEFTKEMFRVRTADLDNPDAQQKAVEVSLFEPARR